MRNSLYISVVALLLAAWPGSAAELVMFESAACEWCELWDEEIAPIYAKTGEARLAPLRRVDIHGELPADLRGLDAVVYTPTFVLMRDGAELGRILGYGGEDHFWGLLGILLERLRTAAPKQACLGTGGERTAAGNDGGVRRC